jgi:integrase/recombinase XerD
MHPEDFLTLEEWHRLLAAAPTTREKALLWLMAGCGLRVSEVAALKIEHLDGAGGYLHVVNGKGKKQRTSILPNPVMEALEAHLHDRDSGYIFDGRDQGHISTRQIQKLLDEAAAGLKGQFPTPLRSMSQITRCCNSFNAKLAPRKR